MHKVLVYGTLRPGNSPTVVVPGVIYDLGWFPGLDLSGSGSVTCEIIEVDDEGLARLDGYEGYSERHPEGSLYIRRFITEHDAFIYEYNLHNDDPREGRYAVVDSGDWLVHTGKASGVNSHLGEQ